MADECEAFLAGTYWEYLIARSREPAPWVYLNHLAHIVPEELLEIAGLVEGLTPDRVTLPVTDWLDIEVAIAGQVVAMTQGDLDAVAVLQRRVLVPLELALAADPLISAQLTPQRLVALTRTALLGRSSSGAG